MRNYGLEAASVFPFLLPNLLTLGTVCAPRDLRYMFEKPKVARTMPRSESLPNHERGFDISDHHDDDAAIKW